MVLRLILFLFVTQFVCAQDPLPNLLDSLAQTSNDSIKSKLSMEIAARLANDDWKRALYYIEVAEKSAKNTKSDKMIADFEMQLGYIYFDKDALDIALEHFLKSYEYFESQSINDRYEIENILAITYARTNNKEKAVKYFKLIYTYEKTRNNKYNMAGILNNMGRVWTNKNVDSSLYYFNKSLEIAKDEDYPGIKVFLYTNLGNCYLSKKEFATAENYLQLALNEITPEAPRKDVAWIYNNLANFYLETENLDSAIYYSEKAVKILDSIAPFSFNQQKTVKILYDSYKANNDFEMAAKYFESYLAISDSINLEDKKINVQKLLIEEEYRNLDKIKALETSKRQSNTYTFIFGLIALLLLLAILLYRYRNKLKQIELEKQLVTSKQKELNSNLELKNQELIGKAMVEMHRSKIIEDILKDLKEVRLKAIKKETQSAIDYITKRLEINTSSSAWDEFELSFEQVHESFYKNLLIKHPDLTPRDKRLCALLKLNLTSKEIAQITGQSSKSVENARTRLRKKLDITNSQTDLSFYLSNLE